MYKVLLLFFVPFNLSSPFYYLDLPKTSTSFHLLQQCSCGLLLFCFVYCFPSIGDSSILSNLTSESTFHLPPHPTPPPTPATAASASEGDRCRPLCTLSADTTAALSVGGAEGTGRRKGLSSLPVCCSPGFGGTGLFCRTPRRTRPQQDFTAPWQALPLWLMAAPSGFE